MNGLRQIVDEKSVCYKFRTDLLQVDRQNFLSTGLACCKLFEKKFVLKNAKVVTSLITNCQQQVFFTLLTASFWDTFGTCHKVVFCFQQD